MFSKICDADMQQCCTENLKFHEISLPGLGRIRGVRRTTIYHEAYYSFEDISYGHPPKDSLRFKAPLPCLPWKRTRDCTRPGNKPVHLNRTLRIVKGDEDCLSLNVYAKNVKTIKEQKVPVMAYIYGGDFESGHAYRYRPDYFMFEDIVLVTINYRVSAFGFLTLEDSELEVPGNAGLKDILLALQWVHKNIVHFGGNTRNITLFGKGSGAGAIHLLSCCPAAKGLFQKAILMSGSLFCQWCHLPRTDIPYTLAKTYGYKGPKNDRHILAFLRLLPAGVVADTKLLSRDSFANGILFSFAPTVEPYIMPNSLITDSYTVLLQTAWGNRIPMMIGGGYDEGLRVLAQKNLGLALSDNTAEFIRNFMLPPDLKSMLPKKQMYETIRTLWNTYNFKEDDKRHDLIKKFFTLCDIRVHWHGLHRTCLSRQKLARSSTYQYFFDFTPHTFEPITSYMIASTSFSLSSIYDDVWFLFRKNKSWKLGCNSPEYHLMRHMIKMWTCFARCGDPNYSKCEKTSTLPDWLPLSEKTIFQAFLISKDMKFDVLPNAKLLRIWDRLYPYNLY